MSQSLSASESTAEQAQNRLLAHAIDHTKLTFAAGEDEAQAIEKLCAEAKEAGFFSVCVRPRHVQVCKKLLMDTPVKVATVIGFPMSKIKLDAERIEPTVGHFPLAEKVAETEQAVRDGVDELDLVVDVRLLKKSVQTKSSETRDELLAIRQAAQGVPIKVIIETDLLTDAEIEQVARWCAETGMFMVKTSTGMVEGGQGATLEGVRLIRQTLHTLGSATQIKASGGIKSRVQALAFIDAGATRLGTSSGLALLDPQTSVQSSY